MTKDPRTGRSRFDAVGAAAGRIAMTACPGTGGSDLDADLAAIREWGAEALITLLEAHEFAAIGVGDLGPRVVASGLEWHWLAIADMGVPDRRFEDLWRHAGARLRGHLSAGEAIVVHCRGGFGRAGTLAARLLVELGEDPAAAIATVRRARAGAIETAAQEAHVRAISVV